MKQMSAIKYRISRFLRSTFRYILRLKPPSHEKAIKNLLNILFIVLLLLLIEFIVVNIVKERKKKITYIDYISFPDTLKRQFNADSTIVTREFIQKLYNIRNKTYTRVIENDFHQRITKDEQLNIEILDNSFDVSSLINYFADYRRKKNFISGEILTKNDSIFIFNIRIYGKQKIRCEINQNEISNYDNILRNIADSVYKIIEPYQYCLYKFQNDPSTNLDSLIYKIILRKDPVNLPANNLLGLYLYRESLNDDFSSAIYKLERADSIYSRLCKNNINFTPLYSDYGHVLLQLAELGPDSMKIFRYKKALKYYKKATRRTPFRLKENDPRVYCRIVICKAKLNKNWGLKKAIKKAIKYVEQGQEGFDNYSALKLLDKIKEKYFIQKEVNLIRLLTEELEGLIIKQFKVDNKKKYIKYVDPFIGSTGKGHTFPGAALPFSMVKIGPDYYDLSTNSGYKRDSTSKNLIVGFSHIHVSGTGGGPKYGNIRFTPYVKLNNSDSGYFALNEKASPGYYGVTLANKNITKKGKQIFKNPINCEFTLSDSAAFHKYIFPNRKNAFIFINAGSLLGKDHCCNENQKLVNANINQITEEEISGNATFKGGWNLGSEYTVYFYAVFDKPFRAIKDTNNTTLSLKFRSLNNKQVQCQVGISFKDLNKAKENAKSFNHWNFQKSYYKAQKKWNNILSKIEINTDNVSLKKSFYSALYRVYLMPTNRSNNTTITQNAYYDDYYAIWDTYRTADPLRLLLSPKEHSKILNSLIDLYEKEGFFIDARSGDCSGRTQGGSNVDLLFSEAKLKGIKGINYDSVLSYLVKNSKISVFTNSNDPFKTREDSIYYENKFGRPSIKEYLINHYIPADTMFDGSYKYSLAGSRTMEYAYNDFGIYRLADQLFKENPTNSTFKKIKEEYFNRAIYYRNIINVNYEYNDIKGFMLPRFSNKSWYHSDKKIFNNNGTWGDYLYEGTSPEYTLFAPHDMLGLINILGDSDSFMNRLDDFHYKNSSKNTDKIWFNVANEPSFLTPYLYHWLGYPEKSCKRIREIVQSYYFASSGGLPGNDDAGAMGAWLIFSTMGFYPLAGADTYLITSPFFKKVVIKLDNSKTITLLTKNLSKKNIFIKKLTFNGNEYNKSWITHDMIKNGGVFCFEMDSVPSEAWGKDDLPYSLTKPKNN